MRRAVAVLVVALAASMALRATALADDAALLEMPALLHEVAPVPKRLAILWNSRAPRGERDFYRVWDAARGQGLLPIGVELEGPDELDAALDRALAMQAGLLVLLVEELGAGGLARVVAVTTAHALPAVSVQREFAAAGGLMSLGPDGTLVVNLKAARALGLALSPAILQRAAEVLQ